MQGTRFLAMILLLFSGFPSLLAQSSSAVNGAATNGKTAVDEPPIHVFIGQPLAISYTTVDEVLRGKIIRNALTVKVDGRSACGRLYAQISFPIVGTSKQKLPALELRLVSKSPNRADFATQSTVLLGQGPALVFDHPLTGPDAIGYILVYDLAVLPTTDAIPPADIPFSLDLYLSTL